MFYRKLEKYQNITGISDEAKTMIWQKSADIRAGVKQGYFHSYLYPKDPLIQWFRGFTEISIRNKETITGPVIPGAVNPINYEIVEYNNQIEYNNGVLIILQPGWYTFTANTWGANENKSTERLSMMMVVDNVDRTHAAR